MLPCQTKTRVGNRKPESRSPNLTRTRATPGRSENHWLCFRTACPTGWDSRPSTSTDTPPQPKRESPVSSQVGGKGFQHLIPGLQNKCPSTSLPSPGGPSHPRGVFNSRKGTVYIKHPTRSVSYLKMSEQAGQPHRCDLGQIPVWLSLPSVPPLSPARFLF